MAQPLTLTGVGMSPGRATGPVVAMPPPIPEPSPTARAGEPPEIAVDRLRAAVRDVVHELQVRADAATGAARDLLEVTAAMAGDPTLLTTAETLVRERGTAPERAVWEAAGTSIAELTALGGYLAQRTRDVADVRDRIIAALTGRPAPGIRDPGRPFVLLADDLAPADAALLDPERVVALITRSGGETSHTAILTRALGIPAVVVHDGDLQPGSTVLVDGGAGTVTVDPSPEQLQGLPERRGPRRLAAPGRTADGHRVALLANVGTPAEAQAAAEAGAEGIGLFRTELCFLDRPDAPTLREQVDVYRQVLRPFAGRTVVFRTLDAGADKPLAFRPAAEEPNPALGVRGLRTAVTDPDLLDTQLAAIAQAAGAGEGTDAGDDVRVMAPMVSTVTEAEDFVARCVGHGLGRAGVMIEVPAAALRAGTILSRAAFASIGTNDLTQYAMAADRTVGALGALCTPWQPGVLELVAAACRGGAQQARPVGVCGEAAADPALAAVLVGLGVSSLSMTPRALADVGAVLATLTLDDCVALAAAALAAETAEGSRAAVRDRIPALRDLAL